MVFTINHITKVYEKTTALSRICFSVDNGDIVSIIGPSGSGKTTLLKIIAGIENPTDGTIDFETPPSRENPIILVFQDYVLFPHLSVFDNIAFGLTTRKVHKKRIKEKVDSFLDYFDIQDKADSFPAHLSGGQKQRVAIARAMIVNPSILLLDEPFANLDKNLKLETAAFIRKTQKEFGITTISVTHDLEEAFTMSDKIGILLQGKLAQFGYAKELYFNPVSYDIARFLGPVNNIPSELFPYLGINPDKTVTSVYARAEAFEMKKDDEGKGIITNISFTGIMILYTVRISDHDLQIYSLNNSVTRGETVSVRLLHYFNHSEETSL
ncbi:MAG: ABC transporter ATP-binding protein [Spirochaetales bacterium]|nr:ABC transporter ATP-binding protein [Spirochaetales bacterium]